MPDRPYLDRESVTAPPGFVELADISGADHTFGFATRAISFAVAGDLRVITLGGDTVTIPSGALATGVMHPLRVVTVVRTGTTATGIVGYW